jgi:hypothetical protein
LLEHLLGDRLGSFQISYTLSQIPSLFHPECSPPSQIVSELTHLAVVARVSLFATRVSSLVTRMGFSVCAFGLLNQSLDRLSRVFEPLLSLIPSLAHDQLNMRSALFSLAVCGYSVSEYAAAESEVCL